VRAVTAVAAAFTAILGGTFDPVHVGHLRSAEEVRERLGVKDFRFVPAGRPAHRRNRVTPARHRLAMLGLALRKHPGFSIDDREMHRDGPSYMVDTLAELRGEMPAASLLLVIGQDSANSLDRWHRWREIFGLANLVIMQRPDHPDRYSPDLAREIATRTVAAAGEIAGSPHGSVLGLEVTQLQVSSSAIRNLVRAGRTPRFLVPDPVMEYIRSKHLYR
jgi:nicotinate-nucleotide adenylyltransferase